MTNFSAYIKMILRRILRMSFLKLITGRNLIALLIDDDKKKRAIIESARHLMQWLSIPRRSNRTKKNVRVLNEQTKNRNSRREKKQLCKWISQKKECVIIVY